MTVSVVNDIAGEQTRLLAVLYCDVSPDEEGGWAGLEIALWRENHFRAARELVVEYGGREATTAAGGWAATFLSTVEALLCARALSSLVGSQIGGPSLSGGLSAGEVIHGPLGIRGGPVHEAISLCWRALPRQVLVADPLKVVVAPETARSFASACPDTEAVDMGLGMRSWSRTMPQGPDDAGALRRGRRGRDGRTGRLMSLESPLRLLTTGDDEGPGTVILAPEPTTEHLLRLNVLGWVKLEAMPRMGGPQTLCPAFLRGCQARDVLSMLALRRGPVHKAELAELLWPDALPDHWEGAIRGLVTKIRRFLAAGGVADREVLVAEGGYYELRLPVGVTVDRDDATGLVAEAKVAQAAGRSADAAAGARQAVAILERRLQSGDSHPWFDQVRAELAIELLAALDLWAGADLAAGNTEGTKRATTEALAIDPYRESSYRLLMQAHSAAGSRAEALRTYEQCRRRLADELGVGPAPQTQALYIHLLG